MNYDKLVLVTIQYLNNKNLHSLIEKGENPRKADSQWGILSVLYADDHNFNCGSRIRSAWLNNYGHYRTRVQEALQSQIRIENIKKNIQRELFKVKWDCFRLYIRGTSQRYLSALFARFLSKKLQNAGVVCWLANRSSYINGTKEIHGSGKYKCISTNCRNIFSAKFSKKADESDIVIEVFWETIDLHEKIISPPERISGLNRTQLGYKLAAKGTKNVQYENICSNKRKKGNKRNKGLKEFSQTYEKCLYLR